MNIGEGQGPGDRAGLRLRVSAPRWGGHIRPMRHCSLVLSRGWWLAFTMVLLAGRPVCSQLRPLDPVDFSVLGDPSWTVEVGGGIYGGQRASLAGTSGNLLEIGNTRVVWGLGRVALELSGTILRVYEDESVYTDPVGGARPPDGSRRVDAGDARVSTIVRLSGDDASTPIVLRFGTRLPSTDNEVGLGRDQTDFFSTLAVRPEWGRWAVSAEFGLGINGTRDTGNEQIDPLLFGVTATYDAGSLQPLFEATGQHDPRSSRDRRGNENIGEVRLGVRSGRDRWLSVLIVRGWTSTSPDLGLVVRAGKRF